MRNPLLFAAQYGNILPFGAVCHHLFPEKHISNCCLLNFSQAMQILHCCGAKLSGFVSPVTTHFWINESI
tara:strand:+ start:175 stop:384 length:210 start_codon:yes stop_codon:yes gene_type:complete